MPDWDKDRPDGGVAWNLGDDAIRTNMDFLEQALQVVSTFAINPANPTDRMASKFLVGAAASRPVTTVAAQTGIVYFTNDTGRIFINTAGASNTWVELSAMNALTLAGLLTAGGGLSVTGGATFNTGMTVAGGILLAISGNLTLAAGRKVEGPVGEDFLRQNAVNMNPFAHASQRHRLTGSDGAWVDALDALGGLIGGVHTNVNTTSTPLTASYADFATVTRNLTGRGSATSKVLAIAQVHANETGIGSESIDARIAVDGSASAFGPTALTALDSDGKSAIVVDWFPGLSAASHVFTVQARRVGAGTANHLSSRLLLIDLGNATIEGGI